MGWHLIYEFFAALLKRRSSGVRVSECERVGMAVAGNVPSSPARFTLPARLRNSSRYITCTATQYSQFSTGSSITACCKHPRQHRLEKPQACRKDDNALLTRSPGPLLLRTLNKIGNIQPGAHSPLKTSHPDSTISISLIHDQLLHTVQWVNTTETQMLRSHLPISKSKDPPRPTR
jgi:hypothetical protein